MLKMSVIVDLNSKTIALADPTTPDRIWAQTHFEEANNFLYADFISTAPRHAEPSRCPDCNSPADVLWEPALHIACRSCGIDMQRPYPGTRVDHTSENVLIHKWNKLPRKA